MQATDDFVRKANERPKGTRFVAHPSKDGVLAIHPHYEPLWIRFDGTTHPVQVGTPL